MSLNYEQAKSFIDRQWEDSIFSEISEYIKIPCKSPCFDPEWETNGYLVQAARHMLDWCESLKIKGLKGSIEKEPGRSPLLYIEIDGHQSLADKTIFFYGHLDKQPEADGWDKNKGAWQPVVEDGKLYGRGGADDGYAFYTSISAIHALRNQNLPHARCVIMIESGEEGGSVDLPHYFDSLSKRIGNPDMVICIDADCGNYDQLWVTTSLRGIAAGELRVDILREGVHSGVASGVAASSFRIIRQLLDRIEDANTGRVLLKELWDTIPPVRVEQTRHAANIIGRQIIMDLPLLGNATTVDENPVELLLNRTWRPALSTIAAAGFPRMVDAGNVLRPYTALKLSFRLPPTVDLTTADMAIKNALERDPPYNANTRYSRLPGAQGWNASPFNDWFKRAVENASIQCFGKEAVFIGEGGSIPFISMLNEAFPTAQFLLTGLLGPNANAHGPNEFLHMETAKKLTRVVAGIMAAHAEQP